MVLHDSAFRVASLESLLQLSPLAPANNLRVLELCTDPEGISALRLANRYGCVVSVSASSIITGRARRAAPNNERVAYQRAALLSGWPKGAPYDLVLHWQWLDRIPFALLEQCRGYLISPVFFERRHHAWRSSF
jgi:protein-L-isoaspartate O-methyltransferase